MKPHPCARKRQRGAVDTWVFGGFALVALFFLLTEHRAHLYGWLPYLLLAACPLMDLFHGHGSHSRHGGQGADRAPPPKDEAQPPGSPCTPKDPAGTAAHHHH